MPRQPIAAYTPGSRKVWYSVGPRDSVNKCYLMCLASAQDCCKNFKDDQVQIISHTKPPIYYKFLLGLESSTGTGSKRKLGVLGIEEALPIDDDDLRWLGILQKKHKRKSGGGGACAGNSIAALLSARRAKVRTRGGE